MTDQKNPLQMLFHWAGQHPDKAFLHQAIDGQWKTHTWGQVADQVARMAAALKALLPAGSKVAISGRNTAHWLMADQAIASTALTSGFPYSTNPTCSVTTNGTERRFARRVA